MEDFSVKSESKGDVVLDLKDAAYLSSAGVRVIVKMLRNE